MTLTADRLLEFNLFDIKKNDILEDIQLISNVISLHSFIVEMPAFPFVKDSILRDEIIRAVGSTTAIEGNQLTEEEIKAVFEKADKKYALQKAEQEVQNSREVYNFINEHVANNKNPDISLPFLRQIHTLTTRDIRHISNKPGHLRNDQVEFGVPKLPSLFPDQASVELAVNQFIEWYNGKSEGLDNHPVIRALLSHYYLTEIHPFFDGNGRTSRAVESYCLLSNDILHQHFFYVLANFWVKDKDRYLAELRDVRRTCNVTNFIKFGLKGLVEELSAIKDRVKRKVSVLMFSDYIHYLHRENKKVPNILTKRMVHFLEILVQIGITPYRDFISSPSVRALYSNVSISTRSRDIKKLSENRLINLIEKDGIMIIEANLEILQSLVYKVK